MGLPVPGELVTMTLHFQAEGKDLGGFLVKHSSHSPLTKTCLRKRKGSRLLHRTSSAPVHSSHISLPVGGPSLQSIIDPLSDPTGELCKPLPGSSSSLHIPYHYFHFGSISCQPGQGLLEGSSFTEFPSPSWFAACLTVLLSLVYRELLTLSCKYMRYACSSARISDGFTEVFVNSLLVEETDVGPLISVGISVCIQWEYKPWIN